MEEERRAYLQRIPAVNELLISDLARSLKEEYSDKLVVDTIREVTDELREKILEMDLEEVDDVIELNKSKILEEVRDSLITKVATSLVPAVNATGVIIHTNLGRSLLPSTAVEAIKEVAWQYSTLEIDRRSGERGLRYQHVEELLCELTGAEAALVVNNNAAAVLLALSSLAEGREAIISRGELVEIGGSFRIPEVMEESGGYLVEVGATNRVYLDDYRRGINEKTALLLKVHTSNYRINGFTKEVSLKELVKLGEEYNLPVVNDLGSGVLVDLRRWGLSYEPTVQDSIRAGADIVTFSGDKLLGGPQAGIIVGRREYIKRMKQDPLNRALRVDKFTLVALEATLQEYRREEEIEERIPTLRMMTYSEDELKKRAEVLAVRLETALSVGFNLVVRKDISRVGGGALPEEDLVTYVVELSHDKLKIERVAKELRLNDPPIFTRIVDDSILLDVRTIYKRDFSVLVDAVKRIKY